MGKRRRSFGPRAVINSIKNEVNFGVGTSGTQTNLVLAKAVSTPVSTDAQNCLNGCIIKAIYLILDGCGLAATGVQNNMDFYLLKNPGANLTAPTPISVGTSNEKKFIFKTWHFMVMRNQDGNTPFHWEGWVKIPKRYQRMGTDDIINLVVANTASVTGHFSGMIIYKWYT